jgi:NADH:ubiquinone oxidoreductase subunit D
MAAETTRPSNKELMEMGKREMTIMFSPKFPLNDEQMRMQVHMDGNLMFEAWVGPFDGLLASLEMMAHTLKTAQRIAKNYKMEVTKS